MVCGGFLFAPTFAASVRTSPAIVSRLESGSAHGAFLDTLRRNTAKTTGRAASSTLILAADHTLLPSPAYGDRRRSSALPPLAPFQLTETTAPPVGTNLATAPSMNPTRVLEESQIGRYTVRMAIIVDWNGVDVPKEFKDLKKGCYVLLPMDEAPELTEEQESGLQAALASVRAGQGVSLDEARAKANAHL